VTDTKKKLTEKKLLTEKELTQKKKKKKKKTVTAVQPEGADEQLVCRVIDCNSQPTKIPAAPGETHCSWAIHGRWTQVLNDRKMNATDILVFSSDMATLSLVHICNNVGSLWSTRPLCNCCSISAGRKGSHALLHRCCYHVNISAGRICIHCIALTLSCSASGRRVDSEGSHDLLCISPCSTTGRPNSPG
jgi:hypothetical protein